MAALALISDLMTQSQATAAATRAGKSLQVVGTAAALLERAAAMHPQLVILDLSHPGLEIESIAASLKPHLAEGATLVAFGPHVHKARLDAAVAAGCDLVLSRGQFHAQAAELLAERAG